jgi:hypothetical protein
MEKKTESSKKSEPLTFESLCKKYQLLEDENRNCYKSFACSVSSAILVRFICVLHVIILTTWAIISYKVEYLMVSYFISFVILIEGAYAAIVRQGRESKYFSLSIYMYILACVLPIWVLTNKRFQWVYYNHIVNGTILDGVFIIANGDPPEYKNSHEIIYRINENVFMAVLVLSAWLLPKDDINRDNSYGLMMQNLTMAADAHELLYSADSLIILQSDSKLLNLSFNGLVLCVWTFSLPLFVMNGTTETLQEKIFRQSTNRHIEKIFGHFYWKYFTTMLLMDGPFFIIRMFIVSDYKIIGLQNIFYISKNILQNLIIIVRIYGKVCAPDEHDMKDFGRTSKEKTKKSKKLSGGGGSKRQSRRLNDGI